jgi:hypothetical protein
MPYRTNVITESFSNICYKCEQNSKTFFYNDPFIGPNDTRIIVSLCRECHNKMLNEEGEELRRRIDQWKVKPEHLEELENAKK